MIERRAGMRVEVWSGDQSRKLGLGTYEGEATRHSLFMNLPDRGLMMLSDPNQDGPVPIPDGYTEVASLDNGLNVKECWRRQSTTPQIRLDTGEVVYGHACWWRPVAGEPSGEGGGE